MLLTPRDSYHKAPETQHESRIKRAKYLPFSLPHQSVARSDPLPSGQTPSSPGLLAWASSREVHSRIDIHHAYNQAYETGRYFFNYGIRSRPVKWCWHDRSR